MVPFSSSQRSDLQRLQNDIVTLSNGRSPITEAAGDGTDGGTDSGSDTQQLLQVSVSACRISQNYLLGEVRVS